MSKIYERCVTIYTEMSKTSKPLDSNKDVLVYTGSVSNLFDELGFARGWYSKLMSALMEMHCIEQIHRGGGKDNPSVWALYKAPDEDEYFMFADGKIASQSSRIGKKEIIKGVDETALELIKSLPMMYKVLMDVVERVVKIETRLKVLTFDEVEFEDIVASEAGVEADVLTLSAEQIRTQLRNPLTEESVEEVGPADDLEFDEEDLG